MTIQEAILHKPHPFTFICMNLEDVKQHDGSISIEIIEKYTCEVFGVEPATLQQKRRSREIVQPRQVIMYLAKMMTRKSLIDIGRYFGGFDHTTVLHAAKAVKDLLDTDEEYKSMVTRIAKSLGKKL